MIWSAAFWRGAAERAIKTAAQTLGASFAIGVPVFEIDWKAAVAITATATIASVLTSIGNADFTAGATPVIIEHDGGVTEAIHAAYPEASGEPR